MPTSIMSTAQAGLQVAQAGLLVTSQNVAGASVEGFSRRDANTVINRLASNAAEINGTSFAVEGFTRDYSRLLESQRLVQQGKTSYSETLVQTTEVLDVMIADSANSVAGAVSQFFDAAGQMIGAPNSIAYRSNLTGKAELVVQRVIGLADTIRQVESDARTALKSTLDSVNAMTGRLTEMNVKIVEGGSANGYYPSADYLDERDRILMDLQKKIGGQSVINADGTASHYLQGIPIVEGAFANMFLTNNLEGNVDQIQVQYTTLKSFVPDSLVPPQNNLTTPVIATSFIQGGEAGAYLKIVRDFVPDLNRRLDSVAIGLLKTVNEASPTPIFGFKVPSGQVVSDTAKDPYVSTIPTVGSANDIYTIRDRLNPDGTNYKPELAQLKAQNLVSLAPANPNDWDIDADDAKKLEALRSRFTAPIADVTATVANTIATWANDKSANDAIMKTLNDRRESISGVNLDEEAANMVKFQQLYAASSKIIQTSGQMFDTLLAMLS